MIVLSGLPMRNNARYYYLYNIKYTLQWIQWTRYLK